MKQYQGIDGLSGHAEGRKQAWGAVLTIGRKDPKKGFPTDTDKFFIKKPQTVSTKIGNRTTLFRENDPEFNRFHLSDKPQLRQIIRFYIIHHAHMRNGWDSMIDAFQFQLKAYQLPKIMPHEKGFPTCTGNGKEAYRWNGKEFQDIKCPNYLCQFRQGRPAPCKPFARLAFQMRWDQNEAWNSLPTPLTKWETHSWYNIDSVLLPFFTGLHKQASALKCNNYSFYGLPCVIKLGKRTAKKGNTVPSISISTDLPNGMTLQEFFLKQKQTQDATCSTQHISNSVNNTADMLSNSTSLIPQEIEMSSK